MLRNVASQQPKPFGLVLQAPSPTKTATREAPITPAHELLSLRPIIPAIDPGCGGHWDSETMLVLQHTVCNVFVAFDTVLPTSPHPFARRRIRRPRHEQHTVRHFLARRLPERASVAARSAESD